MFRVARVAAALLSAIALDASLALAEPDLPTRTHVTIRGTGNNVAIERTPASGHRVSRESRLPPGPLALTFGSMRPICRLSPKRGRSASCARRARASRSRTSSRPCQPSIWDRWERGAKRSSRASRLRRRTSECPLTTCRMATGTPAGLDTPRHRESGIGISRTSVPCISAFRLRLPESARCSPRGAQSGGASRTPPSGRAALADIATEAVTIYILLLA